MCWKIKHKQRFYITTKPYHHHILFFQNLKKLKTSKNGLKGLSTSEESRALLPSTCWWDEWSLTEMITRLAEWGCHDFFDWLIPKNNKILLCNCNSFLKIYFATCFMILLARLLPCRKMMFIVYSILLEQEEIKGQDGSTTLY